MGWFNKKPTVVMADLDKLHQEAIPHNDAPIISAHYGGNDGWAAQVGVNLPPVANQDRILVHYDRPPADKSGKQYWNDRNASAIERGSVEHYQPDLFKETVGSNPRASDPRLVPIPTSRPTTQMSPSNFRFTRPFDQNMSRHLNGSHFSMASMHRSYPINQMQAPRRFRNTYRIEPPPLDTNSIDLPNDTTATVPGAIYASPTTSMNRNAFRLGN